MLPTRIKTTTTLIGLVLCTILGLAGQAAPAVPGAIAKSCYAEDCGYIVIRHGKVRFVLTFGKGPVPPGSPVGTYVPAAQALVPKTEAPIRELRTANGWTVVASAFLDGSSVALHVRMIRPKGVIAASFRTDRFLDRFEAGTLFGDEDQVLIVGASGSSRFVNNWWVYLLPASGQPLLVGEGEGWIKNVRRGAYNGMIQPGITVQRQHTVDNDANRVLTVTEYWVWHPEIAALALAQH